MALTERLAILIDAKTGGAVREFRKVQREVGAIEAPVTRTDRALRGLGLSGMVSGQALKAGLATAAVAGAFGLAKLTQNAVGAASALNEQASAAEIQFGSASAAVKDFADSAAGSIGLSERAALQASNNFGTFFANIGVGREEAAKFSTGLTSLASDLASLKDISTDESITKLTSGLAGEQEALRRLGIFISEAGVKARAAELGFKPLNGLFSDQAKVIARLSLILEQTGQAQGNFALTSDQLANSQRTLGARTEDLAATVGSSLTPIVADATQGLSNFVAVAEAAAGVVGDLAGSLGGLPTELFKFGPLGGFLGITSRLSVAGDVIGDVGRWMGFLGEETDSAADAAAAAKRGYGSLSDDLPSLAGRLTEVHRSLSEVNKEMADTRGVFLGAVDAENSYQSALEAVDDASRDAAQAHMDLADAQEDQRRTIADLNIEVERNERAVTRASRAVTSAQRDLAEANEDLADAQANYDAVLADFHPESRRAHEALEDLEDAERRQEDAQFNAEDAAYGLVDAQRNLADTTQELRDELNGVGPAADRVRDAQNRVAESSDGLSDAQANLAREAITLEIALAEERDTLAANNEEFEALVGWFEALKAKYPEAAEGIDMLLGRVQALRAEIVLLNEEIGVNMTNALGNVANVLGRFLATPPGFGNPFTAPDPRLDPNHPFPPAPLVPEQNAGKSGFRDINVTLQSDAEPMHVAREIKRQLMPGG